MENVLIAERRETTAPPPGIQRIVSVAYRPEVEYFYKHLDIEKYQSIYFDLDEAVNRFILECKNREAFFYRGISFLQSFRLRLFLYLLNAEVLQRTFRNLANSYPQASFHIEKNDLNGHEPFLSQLLGETCPDLVSRFLILENKSPGSLWTNLPTKQLLKRTLWPLRIRCVSRNSKVLVYSDYYRASAVMARLGGANCTYYTCFPEPKIFLSSLKEHFSFIQNICSRADEIAYRKNIDQHRLESEIRSLLDRSFCGFPQLRGVAQRFLEYLFKTELPAVFFQIDRVYELFEESSSLRSVLLDEDVTPFKNALCQVAMKFKKKCFVETHGALGGKHGFLPLTADHMFVWGEVQKKKLIQWGCSPERLIVSGCSKYETYKAKQDQAIRNRICKKYAFTASTCTISFFPHPSIDNCSPYDKFIRDRVDLILNTLKSMDVQVIIKLHPGERNKDFYYSWVKKNNAKNRIVVTQKVDPLLLAKASDFLIVHDSTMAVDGFAMGKPVIFFPLLSEDVFSDNSVSEFGDGGIFYRPQNMEELNTILKTLMLNPHLSAEDLDRDQVRKSCLNEGGALPEEIICDHLLGRRETVKV